MLSHPAIRRQWYKPIKEVSKITGWLVDQFGDDVAKSDYSLKILLLVNHVDPVYLLSVQPQNDILEGIVSITCDHTA